MSVTIITVGKKHEDWVEPGIQRYQKRLKQPFNAEWVLLAHSSFDDDRARQEESGRILSRLEGFTMIILLDERGKQYDSPAFSGLLSDQFAHSAKIALIIGGAFGVTEELRQKATHVWSLSPLVFPHQLVRLMLIEQLYRAQEISLGKSYHHE